MYFMEKINRLEIAKMLGVSHMTVSRAFMDDQSISPKTRKRILDTCRKHGYSPSPLGRALRKGTMNSICVVVPNIHHDAYSRLIDGLQDEAIERGYNITIFKPKTEGLLTLSEAMFIMHHKFDGVVIDCLCEASAVRFLKKVRTPIVTVVERIARDPNPFYFIGTNDYKSARQATKYLISLGRRKLVHLAGSSGICGEMREKGFVEEASENGIKDYRVVRAGWMFEHGYKETIKLIEGKIEFDAIFACNDYVAAGALHALHERDIKVPDEVSLIGFVGDVLGEALYPPLTTVIQPFDKIGVRAAEVLFQMIRTKKRITGEEFFDNRLTIRKSCSPVSGMTKRIGQNVGQDTYREVILGRQ